MNKMAVAFWIMVVLVATFALAHVAVRVLNTRHYSICFEEVPAKVEFNGKHRDWPKKCQTIILGPDLIWLRYQLEKESTFEFALDLRNCASDSPAVGIGRSEVVLPEGASVIGPSARASFVKIVPIVD